MERLEFETISPDVGTKESYYPPVSEIIAIHLSHIIAESMRELPGKW